MCMNDSVVQYYLDNGDIEKIKEVCVQDSFWVGELNYFKFNFEDAMRCYEKVAVGSKYFNDAISRIMFIKENIEYEDIKDYVYAELLYRKKETEESIKILNLLKKKPSKIAPYSSFLLIKILKKEKKLKDGIQECKYFKKTFTENNLLSEVLLNLGELYELLGKKKQARSVYKEIINKYPNSVVSSLARDRLWKL